MSWPVLLSSIMTGSCCGIIMCRLRLAVRAACAAPVLMAAVAQMLQGGSSLVSAMLFGSTKSAVTATSMKPSITLAPFTQVRQGLGYRV